jgi:hypothetical protein
MERQPADVADNTAESAGPAMIDYDDFLLRIEKIGIGTGKERVETILGKPESKSETVWSYDLRNRKGFPGIPPVSGITVFVGIDIVFEKDCVKDISRSWFDATGPMP